MQRLLSFFAIVRGGRAIPSQSRDIPAGLVGEIRRSVAGAHLQIDHSHRELEFNLVVKGAGSYTLDDNNYVLKPGTLTWLMPGQRHRLVRSPGLEMWVVSLHSDLLDADRIAELAAQPLRILPGHELVDLDRALSQVAQDSDEPAVYNAGITYIAMRAWRASRDSPAVHVRPMHPAVTRALLLLREKGAAVSLSGLSSAAGVTAPYLSRLLIEHTGRSFVDWRNRIRLDRFMDGYSPGANLLNAALDAGFGSYARFHHIFHEMIGCTPSEWVQQSHDPAQNHRQAEMPAADYGMPATTSSGGRQHWLHLVPAMAPAEKNLFGEKFLDRLLQSGSMNIGIDISHLENLEAGLPPNEKERLVASLRHRDSLMADDLHRLFELHDFADTYAGIANSFGLSTSHLAQAVCAVTVITWIAANHGADPGVEQVQAAVPQITNALRPAFKNLEQHTAQRVHSALICYFVILYHALQAARASSDPRELTQLAEAARSSATQMFGDEITTIELSSHGFTRRGKISKNAVTKAPRPR